ncbi:MAG: NAD-dependent succinate-semialdehyde dehydrogenase [Bradymonadaceae bacterium]
MTIRTTNPTTAKPLEEFALDDDGVVDSKLERAADAAGDWSEAGFDTRRDVLLAVADGLRERGEDLARRMTAEMGKPVEEARGEVEKCAWVCDYYADHAEQFLQFEPIETDARRSGVRHEPLGPILAVMPWNFPFWQVFRFAAPNLMAGNVGLLSHAPNVPGCAEAIEGLFEAAGAPDGVFTNLVVDEEQTRRIIRDDRVRGVTLTGSVGAGSAVAEVAASEIKPTVLELGGSDPFVVLEDADLESTVREAVRARTLNSGQSCIAAKRFVVEESVFEPFLDVFEERMSGLAVGDPMDEETDIGPIARDDLLDQLARQVDESLEMGARAVVGGERLDRAGHFYPPTVLTDVDRDMPVFAEETFGPVAAVVSAEDVDEAVELANDTSYGLGASVWTDRERGEELVGRLEAGHVAVNGIVKSDPRLPFGGIGESGYGRELGREGILEFVNKKTVWIG